MKIAVVGLGSMGKRRIRLVQQYLQKNDLADWSITGVDLNAERRKGAEDELGIETVETFEEALANCDAVIVSTSPLSHSSLVTSALQAGKHVFTEINLVPEGYEENIALSKEQGKKLFLSSTFLYRAEVDHIERYVARSRPGTYSYHVGQYLPDWHPWEDYRSFFVADKRTNACRELLTIELPWLQRVFGQIVAIHSVHKKISSLDLPYDDSYFLIIEHENGAVGVLQVDVVCRKAIRNFEFSSEDGYLTWDGSATGLKELDLNSGEMVDIDLYEGDVDQQEGYAQFVVENAYYNELEAFFNEIEGESAASYGYEEDLVTLDLIDRIERA